MSIPSSNRHRFWDLGKRAVVILLAGSAGFGVKWILRERALLVDARSSQEQATPTVVSGGGGGGDQVNLPAEIVSPLRAMPQAEFDQLKATMMQSGADPTQQAAALRAILGRLETNEDFLRAIDLLAAIPGQTFLTDRWPVDLYEVLFQRWTKMDPNAAVQGVALLPNRMRQFDMVRLVLRTWLERDQSAALASINAAPAGVLRGEGERLAIEFLTERDPLAAMEQIRQSADKTKRQELSSTALHHWAQMDYAAARAWLLSQPESDRPQLAEALLSSLVHTDPGKAYAESQELGLSGGRHSVQDRILQSWAQLDAPAALAAALAEVDQKVRNEHLTTVGQCAVRNLRKQDGLAQFEKIVTAETDRQMLLQGMVSGLLTNEESAAFPEAASLIGRVADAKRQRELLGDLGREWGTHDAVAASEWLKNQPPNGQRDQVLGEFVRVLFEDDPAAALIWAMEIQDNGKRTRRIKELLPKWQKASPEEANVWLQQNPGLKDSSGDTEPPGSFNN